MRSITIGRILDIPIRINVTLLLFLPILVWLIAGQIELYGDVVNAVSPTQVDVEPLTEGDTPWIIGVAGALGLFVGVLLHELGHSVAASSACSRTVGRAIPSSTGRDGSSDSSRWAHCVRSLLRTARRRPSPT